MDFNLWGLWYKLEDSKPSESAQDILEMLDPDPYIMNAVPQPWQNDKWISTSEACGASSRILNPQDPDLKFFGNAGSGCVYNEWRMTNGLSTLTEMDI